MQGKPNVKAYVSLERSHADLLCRSLTAWQRKQGSVAPRCRMYSIGGSYSDMDQVQM